MKNVREIVFKEPLVSWALYMVIGCGNHAIAIDEWTWKALLGIIVAGAVSWKTFRTNIKDQEDATTSDSK